MTRTARDTVSWLAPGRVNVIGEHTDYNDGFALPMAISRACRSDVRVSADGLVHVRSTAIDDPVTADPGRLEPGTAGGWERYPLGVLWALQQAGHATAEQLALGITLDSSVPTGSGLSSSAAMICSVAAAVDDLLGLGLARDVLVELTHRAENDFVGAPTGGMDQLASLRAHAGQVLLCDMRAFSAEGVPFVPEDHGLALLVVDSRAEHGHAGGEYRERRASCERAAEALGVRALRDATPEQVETLEDPLLRRRARHIVTENARVLETVSLLRAGRLPEIGPLLTASHASMRDDFEITVAEIDVAVEALLGAGAIGARMTGGGFGGCVIALVAADQVDVATRAVELAYAERGFTAPRAFVEHASEGAHAV